MIFKYGCDELMSDVSISVIVIATCPLLVSLCLSLGEDVIMSTCLQPVSPSIELAHSH